MDSAAAGRSALAGYITLTNRTDHALKLVKVTSPAFRRIEFHHSMQSDGMNTMKEVNSVVVSPHGTFRFAPGGYHLMMWRSGTLNAGDHVPLTLTFSNGTHITTTFVVRRVSS